jgi:PAS domain-containing protein
VVSFLCSALFLWIVLSFSRSWRLHTPMLTGGHAWPLQKAIARAPHPTPSPRKEWRRPARPALPFGNTFTDKSREVVFIKNREHRYEWMSPAGTRVMGRSLTDIIGASDAELFPPEVAERHVVDDVDVLQSGRIAIRETDEPVGGDWRRFVVQKMPWRDEDGQIIGVIGVAMEVSASRADPCPTVHPGVLREAGATAGRIARA